MDSKAIKLRNKLEEIIGRFIAEGKALSISNSHYNVTLTKSGGNMIIIVYAFDIPKWLVNSIIPPPKKTEYKENKVIITGDGKQTIVQGSLHDVYPLLNSEKGRYEILKRFIVEFKGEHYKGTSSYLCLSRFNIVIYMKDLKCAIKTFFRLFCYYKRIEWSEISGIIDEILRKYS